MIGKAIRRGLLALSCSAALGVASEAQEFSFGLTKRIGRGSAISVGVSSGSCAPSGICAPTVGYGGVVQSTAGYAHRSYGNRPYRRIVGSCPPARQWIDGHYQTVTRQVWVPGRTERVWVPPTYATRYDACGNPYQVQVQPGFWRTVQHPGCYENRTERVWVPGHWSLH